MTDSHLTRSPFAKFLREPLLHFVLLGGLIFAVAAWRDRGAPTENELPRIEVTAGTVAWLREGFTRQWNREPSPEELRGLVNDHLREEVLYREGLALGLDRDDTIVRRRMAQKMEFLTQDIAASVTPDDAALRKFFEENAARYAIPARITFQHIYFSEERRGQKLESDAREALAALATEANPEALGDPFLGQLEFKNASAEEITAALGGEFSRQLSDLPAGQWQGPIPSSYGTHLVRVSERPAPPATTFEAVRETVLRDLVDERRRAANQDFVERLKDRYQITIDEAALKTPPTPATKTAQR